MRFSNSILFLGLWLTRWCWVSGGTSYPKPSISVHPSETVVLGGTVNIHCKNEAPIPEHKRMEFYLYKQMPWDLEMMRCEETDHEEVVFRIVNVTPSDAGIYRCIYCYKSYNCQAWSYFSNIINISTTDQFHPKSSTSRNASEKTTSRVNSSAIIWAGAATGSLILILLLLLLALVLYRRSKRGSTAGKRTQPLPVKETNLPRKPEAEGEAEDNPDGVSYAVLNHYSLKRQEQAKLDSIPESCVYASVASG